MMKSVIFLDIDGVLWPYNTNLPKDQYGYCFDKSCVEALQILVEKSQADIVLSSSWKVAGLSAMVQMWDDRSLPGKLIDITTDLQSKVDPLSVNDPYLLSRGYEIETWLTQKSRYKNYLIIDDLPDFTAAQMKHTITPASNQGLTMELVTKGLDILLVHI